MLHPDVDASRNDLSILTTLSRESYSTTAFDAFAPAKEFSLGMAHALAWMCQLAYETADPDKTRGILGDWGMNLVDGGVLLGTARTVLPIASTHGVVTSGRGATIVAFAGTDPLSLANWITNFNARVGPAGVADGFRRALSAVLPTVRTLVRSPVAAGRPLFLTGHSLGGALAVLAAYELQANGIDVAGVYTFGMPRPGNEEFAGTAYRPLLGARTYRLVYGADIVPTVAPSWMGFRHVGRLLLCPGGGRFDTAALSDSVDLDDPQFMPRLSKKLGSLTEKGSSPAETFSDRAVLAAKIARGKVAARQESDLVAAAIELLPPELRDHLPDRYIGALAPSPQRAGA
ncbi:MAG: lipase family protein [Reyranellaceae bacterium]